MSSLILPCETEGAVHIWTDGGQLATSLILAALEGYNMLHILTSGCIVNVNIGFYCVLSFRTFLLGANGQNM
jgi:hypothetical protein